MLVNQKVFFFFFSLSWLASHIFKLLWLYLVEGCKFRGVKIQNPGEGRDFSSYVTSRRCRSSDVSPARDSGRLTSNPQMEPDLQVKTAWNSYLMTFFPKSKRVLSSGMNFNSLEISFLHFICSLLKLK